MISDSIAGWSSLFNSLSKEDSIIVPKELSNVNFSKSRGRGRESGLIGYPNTPEGNERLEKLLEEARKIGNFELANKIIKELKNRGYRNQRKNRKGPRIRGFWLPFWIDIDVQDA